MDDHRLVDEAVEEDDVSSPLTCLEMRSINNQGLSGFVTEELNNHSIVPSSRNKKDHDLADEAVEEDDSLEDDISWSRLDKFLAAYVLLAIWGPLFVALIFPLMSLDDFELNLARALGYTGGALFTYLLAMAQLSRRQPLFFLYGIYYTFLIYVDVCALLLLLLFLPKLLGASLKEASTAIVIFYLLIPLVGWLFLILVARRIILASHDYLFSDTMPNDQRENQFKSILQRGLDENAFRYKYVPKTHLILMCNICIFIGIIVGSLLWKHSLAITLPVSFVCVVDIFYSSCFRFEDEDEDGDPPPDEVVQPADGQLVIQHAGTTGATTQAEEEQGGLV
jgi:hypothetical protein